jgi:hypothetical protein
MPTRRCRTRATTASAITESTSPWTMVDRFALVGNQERMAGASGRRGPASGSSLWRICWRAAPGQQPRVRLRGPSLNRSAWPSRQRKGTFQHHWRSRKHPSQRARVIARRRTLRGSKRDSHHHRHHHHHHHHRQEKAAGCDVERAFRRCSDHPDAYEDRPALSKSNVEYAHAALANETANAVIVKTTAVEVRRRVTVY